MYGRKQLEIDLDYLESQRAESTRLLLAGKMNGFDKLKVDAEIEKAERSCHMKLAGVRMAITDREQMQKSGKMVYWKNRKGVLTMKRHGSPVWQTTSAAHLEFLRNSGYFVIELKGFPPKGGEDGTAEVEAELASPPPPKRDWANPTGAKILARACEHLDELRFAGQLDVPIWIQATALMSDLCEQGA